MPKTITTKEIYDELKDLKKDVKFIKENIVDSDRILSEDDKIALKEAREDFKKGKTTSLEDLKKELNL